MLSDLISISVMRMSRFVLNRRKYVDFSIILGQFPVFKRAEIITSKGAFSCREIAFVALTIHLLLLALILLEYGRQCSGLFFYRVCSGKVSAIRQLDAFPNAAATVHPIPSPFHRVWDRHWAFQWLGWIYYTDN